MGKERLRKVNRLIRGELAKLLEKEADLPEGALVTVTRVDTSPDLAHARVYVASYPASMQREVMRALEEEVYDIQQRLNKLLTMRIVPKIVFREEESGEKRSRVEEILGALRESGEL